MSAEIKQSPPNASERALDAILQNFGLAEDSVPETELIEDQEIFLAKVEQFAALLVEQELAWVPEQKSVSPELPIEDSGNAVPESVTVTPTSESVAGKNEKGLPATSRHGLSSAVDPNRLLAEAATLKEAGRTLGMESHPAFQKLEDVELKLVSRYQARFGKFAQAQGLATSGAASPTFSVRQLLAAKQVSTIAAKSKPHETPKRGPVREHGPMPQTGETTLTQKTQFEKTALLKKNGSELFAGAVAVYAAGQAATEKKREKLSDSLVYQITSGLLFGDDDAKNPLDHLLNSAKAFVGDLEEGTMEYKRDIAERWVQLGRSPLEDGNLEDLQRLGIATRVSPVFQDTGPTPKSLDTVARGGGASPTPAEKTGLTLEEDLSFQPKGAKNQVARLTTETEKRV